MIILFICMFARNEINTINKTHAIDDYFIYVYTRPTNKTYNMIN